MNLFYFTLNHGKYQTTSKEQLAFFYYRIASIIRNCLRLNLRNMNPTLESILDPKVKNVSFDWFISNADGYEYPCSIHYEIDERTRQVFRHGVSFHYGFDNPKDGFKYVKEILQDIVKDLEGNGLEFLQEPVIE